MPRFIFNVYLYYRYVIFILVYSSIVLAFAASVEIEVLYRFSHVIIEEVERNGCIREWNMIII